MGQLHGRHEDAGSYRSNQGSLNFYWSQRLNINNISVKYPNINSVGTKLSELRNNVALNQYDVILIVETSLN